MSMGWTIILMAHSQTEISADLCVERLQTWATERLKMFQTDVRSRAVFDRTNSVTENVEM